MEVPSLLWCCLLCGCWFCFTQTSSLCTTYLLSLPLEWCLSCAALFGWCTATLIKICCISTIQMSLSFPCINTAISPPSLSYLLRPTTHTLLIFSIISIHTSVSTPTPTAAVQVAAVQVARVAVKLTTQRGMGMQRVMCMQRGRGKKLFAWLA